MRFVNINTGIAKTNPPPLVITNSPGFFTLSLDINNWTFDYSNDYIIEWYPEYSTASSNYRKWHPLPPVTDGDISVEHHPSGKDATRHYAYRYSLRTKLHYSTKSDPVYPGEVIQYKQPFLGINAYVITASEYTFKIEDATRVVEGDNPIGQIFYIPPSTNAANMVPFAINDIIEVYQLGAGQITIAPGTDVTLMAEGNKYKTFDQYSTIGLRQRDINVWVLSGDLAV